jgi:hypothetical protein
VITLAITMLAVAITPDLIPVSPSAKSAMAGVSVTEAT